MKFQIGRLERIEMNMLMSPIEPMERGKLTRFSSTVNQIRFQLEVLADVMAMTPDDFNAYDIVGARVCLEIDEEKLPAVMAEKIQKLEKAIRAIKL